VGLLLLGPMWAASTSSSTSAAQTVTITSCEFPSTDSNSVPSSGDCTSHNVQGMRSEVLMGLFLLVFVSFCRLGLSVWSR
jgi:hypothetical protein